jgi:hypothetical protein
MKVKLALSINDEVIKRSKLYAKNIDRSLSELVEDYFRLIIQDKTNTKVKGLTGIVKLPKNFDEKRELDAYFSNKHLN